MKNFVGMRKKYYFRNLCNREININNINQTEL